MGSNTSLETLETKKLRNFKIIIFRSASYKEQLSAFGAAVADVAVGVGLLGEMNLLTTTSYSYRRMVFLVFYKINYYILHRT